MKTEIVLKHPIRCYDSGGKTADRFTVVFMDQPGRSPHMFAAVGMNGSPFHPQGFGKHCAAMVGRHLGKRVPFASLPDDCRKLVTLDLESY